MGFECCAEPETWVNVKNLRVSYLNNKGYEIF